MPPTRAPLQCAARNEVAARSEVMEIPYAACRQSAAAEAPAQRSSHPARLRTRHLRLRRPPSRQSRAGQRLRRGDGQGARAPEAHLAVGAGGGPSLRGADHPPRARLLGALRTTTVPVDADGGDPAGARPRHSLPAGVARRQHARGVEPVRDRQGLRPGALQVLGRPASGRGSAGRAARRRLDPRLHRNPLLAQAEARLRQGEKPPPVLRRAPAGARAARLL